MIVTDEQVISLHDRKGITLWQFGPADYGSLNWTRELREVSKCDIDLPVVRADDRLPDIVPWLHEVSVFDTYDRLLWKGPIQKVSANRNSMAINAKDAAAYMTRTRTPITKRWDAIDPSIPAGELWDSLISQHGLRASPDIKPDPNLDRFDVAVKADQEMMDKPISDLVMHGLRWTVVAGVPILGPATLDPLATLGEADFLGDGIELVRDGSQSFNDVLLRGPDNLTRAHVAMHGLNLQTIVNVDSMFGVSNVDSATYTYLRYVSAIRDAITLSSDTQLHPDAPVSIDELIPSALFVIDVYGVRSQMELERVSVQVDTGGAAVQVALESHPSKQLPELLTLSGPGQATHQALGAAG